MLDNSWWDGREPLVPIMTAQTWWLVPPGVPLGVRRLIDRYRRMRHLYDIEYHWPWTGVCRSMALRIPENKNISFPNLYSVATAVKWFTINTYLVLLTNGMGNLSTYLRLRIKHLHINTTEVQVLRNITRRFLIVAFWRRGYSYTKQIVYVAWPDWFQIFTVLCWYS